MAETGDESGREVLKMADVVEIVVKAAFWIVAGITIVLGIIKLKNKKK